MRYTITQGQFHSLIYSYLNEMYSKKNFKKEINPYVEDGNTWHVKLLTDNNKYFLHYFYFGPGFDDDGSPHNGVGELQVHHEIVTMFRQIFSIRTSKVLDIVGDWVSDVLNVDVDNISIYPKGGSQSY